MMPRYAGTPGWTTRRQRASDGNRRKSAMVKVVKQDRQFIAESVVTCQHMEDGVGNDFIRRPNGLDFLMGNEG